MTLRYAHFAPDHLRTEMSRTERSVQPSSIAQASAQSVSPIWSRFGS